MTQIKNVPTTWQMWMSYRQDGKWCLSKSHSLKWTPVSHIGTTFTKLNAEINHKYLLSTPWILTWSEFTVPWSESTIIWLINGSSLISHQRNQINQIWYSSMLVFLRGLSFFLQWETEENGGVWSRSLRVPSTHSDSLDSFNTCTSNFQSVTGSVCCQPPTQSMNCE